MNSFEPLLKTAIDCLNRRAYTRHDLERKLALKHRGVEKAVVVEVMAELERLRLLNDDQYAEAYIAGLIQKPIGMQKILYHCQMKGLAREAILPILERLEWSEEESAKRAHAAKARQLGEVKDPKSVQKMVGFLKNRGFSERVIWGVVRG